MTYLSTGINESPVITEVANAAIADVRGRAVKYSSGKIVLCGAADPALGIGIMTNDETIAAGGKVDVQIKDIGLVYAGAAITKGANLSSDANGALIPTTSTNPVIAVALEAASAAGQFIRAIIKC